MNKCDIASGRCVEDIHCINSPASGAQIGSATPRSASRWRRCLIGMLFMMGIATAVSAQTITKGLATSYYDEAAYSFNLFSNNDVERALGSKVDGSKWSWNNIGSPSGAAISKGVGAVQPGSDMEFYGVGSDGNLWIHQSSGWTNLATPSGVALSSPLGVTTNLSGDPFVFFVGGDGALWADIFNGSHFSWTDIGEPASGVTASMAVGTFLGPDDVEAYVIGSDGNLWEIQPNGSSWQWTNLNAPPGVSLLLSRPVGATITNSTPNIFIVGSDGNLWIDQYNGSSWSWTNLGTPAGVSLSAAIAAVPSHVFLLGSDGNVWISVWTGSSWSWEEAATPGGATISGSSGATVMANTGVPYAFVTTTGGALYAVYAADTDDWVFLVIDLP